jgi:hypothetical protein
MRVILMCAVALASPVIAAPPKHAAPAASSAKKPAAGPLSGFTFQGHDPDIAETPAKADGSACSPDAKRPGVFDCTDFGGSIAGVNLGFMMREYYQGRLYSLFATGPEYAFGTLLQAFSTKYGSPTMGSKTWQNKAGATFDNTIATWKFRNGTLELDSMGLQRDQISFEFNGPANAPPAPEVKVDF